MATFTIEISDEDVERVLDSLCVNYGRSENIDNSDFDPNSPVGNSNPLKVSNPETKAQFANRMVRKFLSDNVVACERRQAKEQAILSVNNSVSIFDPAVT